MLSQFMVRINRLSIKRKIFKAMGYSIPAQLWIGVTYKCQCNCSHCCVVNSTCNKPNLVELSTEEIKRTIREAKDCCIPRIIFFGGEPLLRADTLNLISYTSSLHLESVLFSNGILLTEKKVEELKKAGITKCNVSLDSSYPEVHDRLRGYNGCHAKAVAGIRNIVKAGVSCSIWTYVSREDVRDNDLMDLKNLINMARDLGVDNIMILFPMAAGNWLNNRGVLLTAEEREKVRKVYAPPFVNMEFPTDNDYCIGGKYFIYINPYGDISPCPVIDNSFANVRQQSLHRILRRWRKNMDKYASCLTGQCIVNVAGVD